MTPVPPDPLPCGCRVAAGFPDRGGLRCYVVHCPLHAQAEALAASHARLLAACRKMKENEVAALTSMASDAENEAFVDGWVEMEAVIAQAPKEPT